MTLQILVNHYKEDIETVTNFLSSLEIQKGVDFDVIICSDGAERLTDEFLQQFNLKIKYLYLEHSGVCHTRNIMLDMATADYIMFCDIDDSFISCNGLKLLMAAARETSGDVIGSPYLAERRIKGQRQYGTYNKDIIRLHGKIFKRQYIIDNQIRFPDELENSGDMMFLWLCYALSKNIIWLDDVFYLWKYNSNSVTKYDEFAELYNYGRTIMCYTLLGRNLQERNELELLNKLVVTVVAMIYLDYTCGKWEKAPQNSIKELKISIHNYLEEFYDIYKVLDENLKQAGFSFEQQTKFEYKKSGNYKNLDAWIKEMLCFKPMQDVLIVGYGVVGHNLEKELHKLKPEIYDKYKNVDTRTTDKYKFAFICVDTPYSEENSCDITEILNAINEQDAEIYIIKSTILPGTTENLIKQTNKHIVFSPEYYGGTQHNNNYIFDYTILGGNKEDCYKIIQLLNDVYDGRHQFKTTSSKTAELVKYMENAFLATKVSFCQQFYRIAEELQIPYEELRELFILDPRINPSHTFVYKDHPYWSSHCLDKDLAAITKEYDAELLKDIIKFNEKCKIKKDG